MFPVPGPISSIVSVCWMAALATMAVTTAGFLRKCCPSEVLGAIRLEDAAADDEAEVFALDEVDVLLRDEREYGADEDEAPLPPPSLPRLRFVFGMALCFSFEDYTTRVMLIADVSFASIQGAGSMHTMEHRARLSGDGSIEWMST